MKSSDLIEDLAKGLEPVKPVKLPALRLSFWIAVSFISVLLGVYLYGVRSDWQEVISAPSFLVETALIFATLIFSAWAAFLFGVPGEGRAIFRFVPLLLVVFWFGFLAARVLKTYFMPGMGFSCIKMTLVIGLVPALLAFVMLCRSAPMDKFWVGVLSALSGASFGAFGVQFVCVHTDAGHNMVWHYLPVVIIALLGGCLGPYIFCWDQGAKCSKGDSSSE